jgi:hypothetical protein
MAEAGQYRRHVRVFVRKRRCHACAAHALHPPGRARTSHASHMRAQLKGRAWPVYAPRMYEHSCKAERGPYMHRACANTAVRQSAACTCIAQVRTQLQGRARPVHASRMYEHSCKADRGLYMSRSYTNTTERQNMSCTCIAHVRTQLRKTAGCGLRMFCMCEHSKKAGRGLYMLCMCEHSQKAWCGLYMLCMYEHD